MSTRFSSWLAASGLLLWTGAGLFAQDTAVSVTYPRDLRKATDTIDKIERFTDGQGRFDWLKIPEALTSVRAEAEQYLTSHPDDLGTLMLLARTGRIEAFFAPTTLRTEDGGWVGDTTDHLAPVHALLDRLLVLEPRLAEAYYWKARLLAMSNPRFDGDSLIINVDWDGCLSTVERAVELAPAEGRYRELLALARAEHGDFAGAADAVRDLDGGKNLVYLLLSDFTAVPMPEDRIALPRVQSTFAEMYGQSGLGGYSNLRVRAFAVPGGAKRIEEFYRVTWPEFTLFFQQEDEISRTFGQWLSPAKTGMRPETSDKFLNSNDQPEKGIMVLVMEMTDPTEEMTAMYPNDPRLLEPFTQVVMVNFRSK